MANPKKKIIGKGYGSMDKSPNLIRATLRMDFNEIVRCLEIDPNSIHQEDLLGNNVMHLCIGGGSPRVMDIMKFFVESTAIDLLHENNEGECPLEMAFGINDQESVKLLEKPTLKQLYKRYPDPSPDLRNV